MTNTLLSNINIQAMVVDGDTNKLTTWVDFANIDIRPLQGLYTISNDAITDIVMQIAEDLSDDGLITGYQLHGGMHILNLSNGVKVIIGKFWPNEVPGFDESKVRMWEQETGISVYQFESIIIECAKKKRPL